MIADVNRQYIINQLKGVAHENISSIKNVNKVIYCSLHILEVPVNDTIKSDISAIFVRVVY